VKEVTTVSFTPPKYAATACVWIIKRIINGLSRKLVSNQLTTVSRKKDSWGFYDKTINVFV
jgi:hypothetical protein